MGSLNKSESVEQVGANVSNFNHNIFDMGLERKWPLVFMATFTFPPHSLPTIYPKQNATFHKCNETQIKITGGTPEVHSDKSLTLLTFEIQDLRINI